MIELTDGSLVTSSSDNTVKIWNLNNRTQIKSYTGLFPFPDSFQKLNCFKINCLLELSDGSLAFVSIQNTIKILNPKNGSLIVIKAR